MKNLEIKDESIQSRDDTVEHWNIYDPVSVFYGRKELIKNIHSALDSNQRVVLTGLGGVGKTQTVAKFTQLYKDEYQKVFWIAADNLNKTMDEIIRYFGFGQYLPKDPSTEMLVKLLLSKVCKVEEKTLIILDDVTNLSSKDFKSLLRHDKHKLSLLMTSQLTDWEDLAVTNIRVPCFEEYESVGFLEGQILDASAEDISTLVGHLQCYPLALHQAICYIRKLKITVPSYIEQFEACRKSVLSMKIKSFSDYDKTLLTVWDMAFHKINEESKNAILVLSMMGYMDNKRINKKTFTYLDNIDEIDVDEIVYLLGQYSLVNERNGFLEIHALVQKMVRYCVEEQNLVEDECPKKLVMDTIEKIYSFKKEDLKNLAMYYDDEDLWYAHVVYLMQNHFIDNHQTDFLNKIGLSELSLISDRRMDDRGLRLISSSSVDLLTKKYKESKEFGQFIEMVNSYTIYIHCCVDTFSDDIIKDQVIPTVIQFENEYNKELEVDHEQLYDWKLTQAELYQRCRMVEVASKIRSTFIEKVLKKKVYSPRIILKMAKIADDHVPTEELLKTLNVKDFDNPTDVIKYFKVKSNNLLFQKRFDEAENVFKEFEDYIDKMYDCIAPIDHFNFLNYKAFFLYKKGKYTDALMVCDQISNGIKYIVDESADRRLISTKALINLALGNFDAVDKLHDESLYLDSLLSTIFSFVKFQKHDFSESLNLLQDFDADNIKNLSWLIKWYAELHKKFNETRSPELLERCLDMKSNINAIFKTDLESYSL
ncbi:uncharacterized protein [Clytia hemisphaerica]|uniref:uncharacterized protein n=1 Tax=Clytia hemisphaerica TaxID=252671 RepID=UPI0034D4504A